MAWKVSTTVVGEGMGSGGAFTVVYGAHTGIGTLPIVYFGNEEQKAKYLPKLASGEWAAAYCLTEAGAGSDALNARTKAVLSEDGKYYILNGEKMFITNAGWASSFVVYAKVDGEAFSGFIVEKDFPGVSTGAVEKKMGAHGSSTRPVILEDAKVPVENLLYEVGKGHKIAFNILNLGRWKLGAMTVGGCKGCVTNSVKYANGRIQFNVPISSFGMIKTKLADMAARTYMAESMMYRQAGMFDDKLATLDDAAKKSGEENAKAIEEYAAECSITKVYGSECLDFCVDVAGSEACIDPGPGSEGKAILVQDPICSKRFSREQAEAAIEYEGRLFYVCCPLCQAEFERDPAHYVRLRAGKERPDRQWT